MDVVFMGALAGALATVLQALINWTWMWVGLVEDTLTHGLARVIFIIPPAVEPVAGELLLALFAQLLVGSIYGVGVALLLANSPGAPLIKGGGVGAFLGVAHLAALPFLARIPERVPLELATLHLLDHIIWGVVAAYLITVLRSESSQLMEEGS